MNPATLMTALQLAKGVFEMLPALKADYEAIKVAGSATPADLAALKAKIEEVDALRLQSWAAADAALDEAAARP